MSIPDTQRPPTSTSTVDATGARSQQPPTHEQSATPAFHPAAAATTGTPPDPDAIRRHATPTRVVQPVPTRVQRSAAQLEFGSNGADSNRIGSGSASTSFGLPTSMSLNNLQIDLPSNHAAAADLIQRPASAIPERTVSSPDGVAAAQPPGIRPGMSARERMAARLAAAKAGSFAVSRKAYDAAIATGSSPEDAQRLADEAVAGATGKPLPVRSISSPESEPPPPTAAPVLRNAVSELAPTTAAPSTSTQQPPNSVSATLQKRVDPPHLPSRSKEEWAIRDAQFMRAMCYGVAAVQGERAYMEDEHCIVPHFDRLVRMFHPQEAPDSAAAAAAASSFTSYAAATSSPVPPVSPNSPSSWHTHRGLQSFFGVYDGHGGSEAARYVRDHLHLNIARRIQPPPPGASPDAEGTDIGDAMILGAQDTESALLPLMLEHQCAAGTVVAFTIFNGMQLYMAHAGDTRAVLCREGVAMDLTQDHKPGLESEQSRVAALGGFISDGCVNGEIAVSRALGDINLESGRKMVGLSADVALSKFYLSDDDEFIILACDGLWDVMNSEAAVSYTRRQLAQHNDVQRAANELVAQALRQQSTDNVTCVLIGFTRPALDGGEPTIVPKTLVGAASRANRQAVPPRPQRLQLNKGGLSKLMAALEIQPRDEEDTDTTDSEGDEDGEDDEDAST